MCEIYDGEESHCLDWGGSLDWRQRMVVQWPTWWEECIYQGTTVTENVWNQIVVEQIVYCIQCLFTTLSCLWITFHNCSSHLNHDRTVYWLFLLFSLTFMYWTKSRRDARCVFKRAISVRIIVSSSLHSSSVALWLSFREFLIWDDSTDYNTFLSCLRSSFRSSSFVSWRRWFIALHCSRWFLSLLLE